MKTNVYVDGFNLYYAIRNTPYKWLDLGKLCNELLKGHDIHRIHYFTARVKARPTDLQQPQRQDVYLRALRTIPNLEIHEGRFLASTRWAPLAGSAPPGGLPVIPGVIEYHNVTHAPIAFVQKMEEKGSDVNIATHLLIDGFRDDYEQAVIITNDTDLVEPIRFVVQDLKRAVGVFNPHRNPSRALEQTATFYRPIREGVLRVSQFPPTVTTATGKVLTKPNSW